ncbi:MAG: hypothetical protein COA45_06700 [Zetaproteobacteria bacterium]|nr:MAG: hypothetical protein COA45_06700 [Zetaproteobacteria bacterium]
MTSPHSLIEQIFNAASLGSDVAARQFEAQANFPGSSNGPADAYRHVYRAAYLSMNSPEAYAKLLLDTREALGGATNSEMDHYNNAIGLQIGQYLKSHGTIDDLDKVITKLIKESLGDGNIDHWSPLNDGILVNPNKNTITLEHGLTVNSIAIMPRAQWEGDNPVTRSTDNQATSGRSPESEGILPSAETQTNNIIIR